MNIDDHIALAKELIAQREEIDAKLLTLFQGGATKQTRHRRVRGETDQPTLSGAQFQATTEVAE